jgi:hypothetical protein
MVQVPVALPVTTPVPISTEQIFGVVLLYLTARPELAVAETVVVLSSIFGVGAAVKLMDWGLAETAGPLSPQPGNVSAVRTVRTKPANGLLNLLLSVDMMIPFCADNLKSAGSVRH